MKVSILGGANVDDVIGTHSAGIIAVVYVGLVSDRIGASEIGVKRQSSLKSCSHKYSRSGPR